jgi:hypothetical protein
MTDKLTLDPKTSTLLVMDFRTPAAKSKMLMPTA